MFSYRSSRFNLSLFLFLAVPQFYRYDLYTGAFDVADAPTVSLTAVNHRYNTGSSITFVSAHSKMAKSPACAPCELLYWSLFTLHNR